MTLLAQLPDALDDALRNNHLAQPPIIITSTFFPISVNAMYANVAGKGRVKSVRYRAWRAAAGWDCKRKGSVHGPYDLTIVLSDNKRRGDASNFVKGLEDLLVEHGIVDDDRFCHKVSVEWGALPAGGWRAEVTAA